MRSKLSSLLFCLSCCLLSACTSSNPGYDPCASGSEPGCSPPPGSPPPAFALVTSTLSQSKGGTLAFSLPPAESGPPVVLNQPSATEAYVLGKLVQSGVASLDLTLQAGQSPGYFEASVSPQMLTPFQVGSLTLQITTAVTTHTATVNLQP